MNAKIAIVAIGLSAVHASIAAPSTIGVELVKPSSADSRVLHFDEANVVVTDEANDARSPLVVFLPGTGGRPRDLIELFKVATKQGYRVIGLSYNDQPSVSDICPRDPDPECSSSIRQMRSFGDGKSTIQQPSFESITSRLINLIAYLDFRFPGSGWGTYLDNQGALLWHRIVISGHSQGAGMAAYVAKKVTVRRVVLFSGPWDITGIDGRPAPWLSSPSKTPEDRWWAERHAQEMTTNLLSRSFEVLKIPPLHILRFDRPVTSEARQNFNPLHSLTVHDISYESKWRELFGEYQLSREDQEDMSN